MENAPENSSTGSKIVRAGMQVVAGVVNPVAGGIFSAIAGAWSEHEQEKANNFFKHWLQMLADEIKEKEQTIVEIMARLNLQDQKITDRLNSKEYQSLIKKTFREWAAAESEEKRKYIRNILANAAASDISSDEVVRLFLDWLKNYSELHFRVIGAIYNNSGITRAQIWQKLGKTPVREDSADADLFKLLIRDLSTGGVIRQHKEVDYAGNFVKTTKRRQSSGYGMKSAFDDEESYELTQLGMQFVHYAMTDLPIRIEAPKDNPIS